jgi:hypothetical protein
VSADHDQIGLDVGGEFENPFVDLALQEPSAKSDTGMLRFRCLNRQRRLGPRDIVWAFDDGTKLDRGAKALRSRLSKKERDELETLMEVRDPSLVYPSRASTVC